MKSSGLKEVGGRCRREEGEGLGGLNEIDLHGHLVRLTSLTLEKLYQMQALKELEVEVDNMELLYMECWRRVHRLGNKPCHETGEKKEWEIE